MAKSKHDKELARAKKKKNQRRRQNEANVNFAKLDRVMVELLTDGPPSGRSIALMINLKGKTERSPNSPGALGVSSFSVQ